MNNVQNKHLTLPPEQQAIRARSFHPSGKFVEFPTEDAESSITARFEKIARLYPGRIALRENDRSITYESLNQTANRIASAILVLANQGNDAIALMFEHGIDVFPAILGVLKAGKFYVALNPSFPRQRNHYMLNDIQARLIVTNSRNLDLAFKLTGDTRKILNIDEIDCARAPDNCNACTLPDALAAIRYTSGSTGEPKGIAQTHRKILHRTMVTTNDELHICCEDRLTLLHSVSFGSAYGHIYGSLLNGACLVPFDIKSEGIHRLATFVNNEQITIYKSPPAVFRQFAELLTEETKIKNLRVIHLSGAPITQLDFDLYKKRFSGGPLLQISMGATEIRGICFAFLDHTFSFPQEGSPIGYPRSGKQILFLDESGRELEDGEIGEIAVKGHNLTLGYWQNPELTEERLVKESNAGDEQIYLTRDLGRRMTDGMIVHLGRKDSMVKIRGYRVDVTEIERALLAHQQIREAAVLALDRNPGEKQLVAYIACHKQPAPTISELYGFLHDKLPEYMLPAAFSFMDSLPVTNGKIDRRAFPEPDTRRPTLATPFVRPGNSIEVQLAKIWAEVLDIHEVGIRDNFFELGGHSLAATRVVSRIIDSFKLELPVKALFDSPTVADMATVINKESQTKLISQKNQDSPANIAGAVEQTITSRITSDSAPLSFAQQRLWFLKQLMPESPSYNLCSAYQITGPLDVGALEQSLNEIIKHHEILRTLFKTVNGQPVQLILPSMTIPLPVIDLREIDSDLVKQGEVCRLAIEEAQRPFDFSRGPLLRVTLLRLADDRYVLLRAIHHIVFDGWSISVLNSELSRIYNSLTSGVPVRLPGPSIQYADYAVWQRRMLQKEALEAPLNYWKRQLQQLSTIGLLTDRQRPAVQTARGARLHFELSAKLSESLNNLAKRQGATLFMVLFTAFQTLLHLYTHQNDIAIGSPVAGRTRRELEELLGFFLNTLVLRTDLSGNPRFVELLARVRTLCIDACSHQEIPFEKLVEELNPTRDLSRHPLVQITFAFQNTPQHPLKLAGLEVDDFTIETGIAIFDLHLFMVETKTQLKGYFVYNTDLFDAGTIKRLIGHFQVLLDGIVANPEKPISKLPLLTNAERQQLLVDWNDTKTNYPKDKCLHSLFEAQVENSPDIVAAVFEDEQVTYRELNSRANQLAHYLKKLGVGPGVLVGLCLKRSIDMIVGLLGILKAGGAYLPIDPELPRERMGFIINDAHVSLLVIQSGLEKIVPSFSGARVTMDRDWCEIARESAANVGQQQSPNHLAYVIYTSGSTGQPKGVMIQQSSLVNFLASMAREPGLTEADTLLAVTNLSFDISALEIYLPLIVGARVVLASCEVAADGIRLAKLILDCGATVMQATPASWRMLLASGWLGNQQLKILCGGDSLSNDLAGQLVSCCASLWNMYGPTETTIWSAVQKVTLSVERIAIGRPIANTQIHILDTELNPVPVGVLGEIHIGGDGVALGYLNQPELTQEKFIADPFGSDPESRLYKTGDSARYLPDGSIEFLGRMDNQVKIRGFRIELGEIESVLRKHPAVREAMVLARKDDDPGDKRLVAYVVTHDQIEIEALRDFLKQKLPDYMIPSAFVSLDALPLTPNGKVKRQALPAPDQSRPNLKNTFVSPRTALEKVLARIWSDMLKVERVGIHDNFFELGGHSLMATMVMSRIREVFRIELALRALFETPTIAGLSAHIDALRRAGDRNSARDNSDQDQTEEIIQ